MTTGPLVSIIMPTYNRAKFIRETIESILAQTYTNWELLIQDDGSEDNTAEVVASVKDTRITYTNFGRVAATGKLKNEGILAAKGDLIAFFDSDDLWPSQKLELQVNGLLQYPEAGFSFTNGYNFIENRHTPFQVFYPRQEGVECTHIFMAYCKPTIGIQITTVMARREAIEKAGYFKENYLFTDFGFIGNLAYHFKAVILYQVLIHRRLHSENYDNPNRPPMGNEYFDTLRYYIKNKMLPADVGRYAMFLTYIHSGEARVKYRKWSEIFSSYLKAWAVKPLSIIPLKKMIKAGLYFLSNRS